MNEENIGSVAEQPEWFSALAAWEDLVRSEVEAVLTSLLGRDVKLSVEAPRLFTKGEIEELFPDGPVVVGVRFSAAELGGWHFLFPRSLTATMADLAAGGEGQAHFDEKTHPESLGELWGQVVASIESDLVAYMGEEITVDMPQISLDSSSVIAGLDSSPVARWNLEIEGLGEAFLLKTVDPGFAAVFGKEREEGPAVPPGVEPEPSGKKVAVEEETPVVKPATFEDFDVQKFTTTPLEKPRNIELLLDINLPVTIELGRTTMLVRDVLELGPGSVIELDKMSGEPVDLFVNDMKFARGEVVVIDENFGVRITELLKVEDRIKALK